MSAFSKEDSNGTFFGRIKKGVTDTVKPVQGGLMRLARNGTTPAVNGDSPVVSSSNNSTVDTAKPVNNAYKLTQFEQVLGQETVDLKALRKQSWNGIPHELRPE